MKNPRTVVHLGLNVTLIVCTALVGVASLKGPAQAPMDGFPKLGPQMPDAQEEIKRLTKKLKLTGNQIAQVETIVTKKHSQILAVMTDESQSMQDKMQQVKKITTDSNALLRALLTAEQQKKFDKIVAAGETGFDPPDGMPEDGPPGGGPPPPLGAAATYYGTPSDRWRPPFPQLSNTMLTLQDSRSLSLTAQCTPGSMHWPIPGKEILFSVVNDESSEPDSPKPEFCSIHRQIGGASIFFVANTSHVGAHAEIQLPISGMQTATART